jgi:type VI secretion system protein VasD
VIAHRQLLAPKPSVQSLGGAMLFREFDRAKWKAVSPIAVSGSTRLVLAIGGNKAELIPA